MDMRDSDSDDVVQLKLHASMASRNLLLSQSKDKDSEQELDFFNSDDEHRNEENEPKQHLARKCSSLIVPMTVEQVKAQHHHDEPHYPRSDQQKHPQYNKHHLSPNGGANNTIDSSVTYLNNYLLTVSGHSDIGRSGNNSTAADEPSDTEAIADRISYLPTKYDNHEQDTDQWNTPQTTPSRVSSSSCPHTADSNYSAMTISSLDDELLESSETSVLQEHHVSFRNAVSVVQPLFGEPMQVSDSTDEMQDVMRHDNREDGSEIDGRTEAMLDTLGAKMLHMRSASEREHDSDDFDEDRICISFTEYAQSKDSNRPRSNDIKPTEKPDNPPSKSWSDCDGASSSQGAKIPTREVNNEIPKIIISHEKEIHDFKEELKTLHLLLDSNKHENQPLVQGQNASVADKQVQGIQDTQLSDANEKLLIENTKLQHEHEHLKAQMKKNVMKKELDNLRSQNKKIFKALVSDKHLSVTKAKDQEHNAAALLAENEALHASLKAYNSEASWEAELWNEEKEQGQSAHTDQALHQQIQALKVQIDAKQHALNNSRAHIQHMEQSGRNKQQTIDNLQAQLKEVTSDLEDEQIKVLQLENQQNEHEHIPSSDVMRLLQSHMTPSPNYNGQAQNTNTMLTQAEMKVCMIEYEQESTKHDLERANDTIQSIVSENTELVSQMSILRHDVGVKHTQVFQLSNTNNELEQKLLEFSLKLNLADQERLELEQDASSKESEMLSRIEVLKEESKTAQDDCNQKNEIFEEKCKNLEVELNTSNSFMEASTEELDDLRNNLARQQQKITELQLCTEENQVYKVEVDRLSKELANKMEEVSVGLEAKQSVYSQHVLLQNEKIQSDQQLQEACSEVQHYQNEVSDLKYQLQNVSEKLAETKKYLSDADAQVAAMETDTQSVKQALTTMETMLQEVNELADIFNKAVESTLLSAEQVNNKQKVPTLKLPHSTLRDVLNDSLHQMDLIRQDIDIYSNTIQSERKTINQLKEHCQAGDERIYKLEGQLNSQNLEMEALDSKVEDMHTTIEKCKQDREKFDLEIEELSNKLSQKNDLISTLKRDNEAMKVNSEALLNSERSIMLQEKSRLESDLKQTRMELSHCQKQLHDKESDLEDFLKTSIKLETEIRIKVELEEKVEVLQRELKELTMKNVSLMSDNIRCQELMQHCKEESKHYQEEIRTMKEEIKMLKDEYNNELKVHHNKLTKQYSKYNLEISSLQDNYNKVLIDLRIAEISVASLKESKESLTAMNQQLDFTVKELKSHAQEELTSKKLMEQKIKALKSRLAEIKDIKAGLEVKVTELKNTVNHLETDRSAEHKKCTQLRIELRSQTSTSLAQDQYNQNLHMQISEAQADKASLHNEMKTNKQNLTAIIRRLRLELKTQAYVSYENRNTNH